ncbi:hypothetical protein Hsero_0207 [Herbaspirillum seropedicae SmR1]|uniref:Uncharacterized protein n=1 Tax=Herbaspirillum seropedicae (strain SmR1) TaxID=757424 RepID=D8IV14_HERSS|nr:hypothetical protein Hsero_0207 [Herbaspirillum seropedicae SmR1]
MAWCWSGSTWPGSAVLPSSARRRRTTGRIGGCSWGAIRICIACRGRCALSSAGWKWPASPSWMPRSCASTIAGAMPSRPTPAARRWWKKPSSPALPTQRNTPVRMAALPSHTACMPPAARTCGAAGPASPMCATAPLAISRPMCYVAISLSIRPTSLSWRTSTACFMPGHRPMQPNAPRPSTYAWATRPGPAASCMPSAAPSRTPRMATTPAKMASSTLAARAVSTSRAWATTASTVAR